MTNTFTLATFSSRVCALSVGVLMFRVVLTRAWWQASMAANTGPHSHSMAAPFGCCCALVCVETAVNVSSGCLSIQSGWIEDPLESRQITAFFAWTATVAIATLCSELGLLNPSSALRATLLTTLLYRGSGVRRSGRWPQPWRWCR